MKLSYWVAVSTLMLMLLVVSNGAAASPRSQHLGDRTLRQGDKGHDVRVLQQYLTLTGITAKVDGVFGASTTRAVRAFERSQRRVVDGQVTPDDARALHDVARNGSAVASASSGGAHALAGPPADPPGQSQLLGPGAIATVGSDGLAIAPEQAPVVVQRLIAAANEIATKPYIYGGGHGRWKDAGYDCSGSVSYALHGAGLLQTSMASGGFMTWAEAGPGQWVSTYATPGHMYMVIAGLRFDTSGQRGSGSRWQSEERSPRGYSVRHPVGL